VRPGGVIDAVAATARGASLEANQLCQQPRVIEQIELVRIDGGQQVSVQIGLRLGGRLVGSPVDSCLPLGILLGRFYFQLKRFSARSSVRSIAAITAK
jgi:hypothetical protein